jgi:hypothetical protein
MLPRSFLIRFHPRTNIVSARRRDFKWQTRENNIDIPSLHKNVLFSSYRASAPRNVGPFSVELHSYSTQNGLSFYLYICFVFGRFQVQIPAWTLAVSTKSPSRQSRYTISNYIICILSNSLFIYTRCWSIMSHLTTSFVTQFKDRIYLRHVSTK